VSTVHVLANPAARKGRGATPLAQVTAALRAQGADPVDVAASTPDAARTALRALVAEHATRVVLVGGDGLVHLAAQELAGHDVAIGIGPAGTGNDFAHALGLDDGALDARVARALAPTVALDAIASDGTWIASVATLGFSARVNARANALRRPRGRARYTIATMAELPALRPVPVVLELDDRTVEVDATLLAVANTSCFGGGMRICPDARPDDGLLDVAVIGAVGRATLLTVFPRVFRGSHVDHPRVTMHRAARVVVRGTDDEVWGDGEPVGPAPRTFVAVPGALHVAGAR
jgi:diacylglycerol kinase (ATP)